MTLPYRKNAPPILSEEPFKRGNTDYIRRNYQDGTVDLILYDKVRAKWIFEIYKRTDIPAMNYDFEECLSSSIFHARYLSYILLQENRHEKKENITPLRSF